MGVNVDFKNFKRLLKVYRNEKAYRRFIEIKAIT